MAKKFCMTFATLLLFFANKVTGEELVDSKTDASILEDAKLDTFSLIRKYGYPCEIHRVYTEDGYILEVHRIPYGANAVVSRSRSRAVVFLQHGLLSSSAEWVLMMPGKGLAYILADAGYDVWMGNARGNTYSKHHVWMRPNSSSFWKFSWHEIGYFDLPAMVDYALKETGQQRNDSVLGDGLNSSYYSITFTRLNYIGFSQGTTVFWVMTSTRPEYNDKIIAMHALAPIGFVGNIRSPLIRAIAPFTNSLERILKLLGRNEFMPNGVVNDLAGQRFCVDEAITQVLCTNLLFLICGPNADQLNTTMLPLVLGHTPAGASTRQLIHFGQLYKSGQFRQFDYGVIKNRIVYGTYKPPPYKLSNIRTPVFLHYGDNDWLSSPKDVDKLMKAIPSVVGKFRVPLEGFNHLDFVFAIDAKKLIYDRVMNIMTQFKSMEN